MIALGIRVARVLRNRSSQVIAKAVLKSYGVTFGSGFVTDGIPLIVKHDSATIQLGNNVVVINRSESNAAGVIHRTILAAPQPGGRLIIGNNVGMSGATLNAWTEIVIEDRAMLGTGTTIYDTDFHPTSVSERHLAPTLSNVKTRPVRVSEGAWIGAHATILKGVTIGRFAIVGHSALVTKDVPDFAIAVGVPARVIGYVEREST